MPIFASDLVEGLKLPLPDPQKPILSLEPYIEEAWGGSAMGNFVGSFMDVARDFSALISNPSAFAGKVLGVTDLIPSEAIPFASAILSLGLEVWQAKHEQDIRETLFGLALGTAVVAGLAIDPTPPWRNAVDVPRFIDCSDRFDARARTVLQPQRMPAPWRNPGSYPQPSGNCGRGYAVWCNFEHFPHGKKKPGAGGSRCAGKVDVSVLLYPYWTGARPPGPAPAFFPKDAWERDFFGKIDTNADMLAAQSYYLGTCTGNFRVRIADVVRMRNNLKAFVGLYETMRVADEKQNYTLSDKRLSVAISMCDAFIAARAAFVRTDEALGLVTAPGVANRFDPDAKAETLAWHRDEIEVPKVPSYVPGVAFKDAPANQQYQVSDGEGPFVGYTPDLSAYIQAENTGSGGSGIFLLLGAVGLTYFLTQGAK